MRLQKILAEEILPAQMTDAGIPLSSITARCMFEATRDSRGRPNCKFGPTPLWTERLRPVNEEVLEFDFKALVAQLIASGHAHQRAGRC